MFRPEKPVPFPLLELLMFVNQTSEKFCEAYDIHVFFGRRSDRMGFRDFSSTAIKHWYYDTYWSKILRSTTVPVPLGNLKVKGLKFPCFVLSSLFHYLSQKMEHIESSFKGDNLNMKQGSTQHPS